MAFEAYLKLDGVEGEATREGYEKQIPLLSFNWGAMNPSSPIGSGAGSGKVSISGFQVNKFTDKSSAPMFQACCSGKHFPKATITVLKAGGDTALDYLRYDLGEVFIDSINWSGSEGMDVPSENVSFTFGKVEVNYTEQKADGSKGGTIVAGWDLKGAKPLGGK